MIPSLTHPSFCSTLSGSVKKEKKKKKTSVLAFCVEIALVRPVSLSGTVFALQVTTGNYFADCFKNMCCPFSRLQK